MPDFETLPLGTILDALVDHRGRTPKKLGDDFAPAGVPVVSAKSVRDGRLVIDSDTRFVTQEMYERWMPIKLEAGDVLLTSEAPLGEAAYLPSNTGYCLGQRLFALRANRRIVEPRFLYYALRSPTVRGRLAARATGTTAQGIRQAELAKVLIDLPPLAVQEDIAELLGSLDDKIDLNRRMNETLGAIAQAIFKSWFVDFDPVRDTVEGREDPGMAETVALFSDSFEASELGPIPKGWCATTVDEIAALNALSLRKEDDLDLIQYVEISSVDHGEIVDIETYPRGLEPSRARRRVQHGDTVLSTVRPERRAFFLCLDPPESLIVSTGFVTVTPVRVPWSFLHAAVTRGDVFDHLGRVAEGGAYPAVRPEVVGAWKLALPSDPRILAAYQRLAGPLFERAELNRRESRTMVGLRDSLLPKLISGQIRIRSSERSARDVVTHG